MSATAEELEVSLDEPVTPKADGAAKPEAKVEAKPEPKVEVIKTEPEAKVSTAAEILEFEDGLKTVKKQLEDERAARLDAERRADEAARGEHAARLDIQGQQKATIDSAIATVKQAQEALKVRYREARGASDVDAEFEIQEQISVNAARLLQLEQGKKALESAPPPQIRVASDPVEQFAVKLTPQSGAWVRAHPEFVRDANKNRQMVAAHELAIARGNAVDTPEYFASIERTLDISAPVSHTNGAADPEESPMSEASKPVAPKRPAAPAAAPVSRAGNAGGERPNSNTIKLTAAEVEIALSMKDAKESDQDALRRYARAKEELKKEGQIH
jgi:hypothetical protein